MEKYFELKYLITIIAIIFCTIMMTIGFIGSIAKLIYDRKMCKKINQAISKIKKR